MEKALDKKITEAKKINLIGQVHVMSNSNSVPYSRRHESLNCDQNEYGLNF